MVMKTRLAGGLMLIILLTLGRMAAAATFMAGAATADITPDIQKWKVNSIGYGSHKVMTGVHDRQFCEALAVSDGANEAMLITCDLMGTPPVLRAKVLKGLEGTGLTDVNLLMACSHTHSGPGNMMPNLIARIGFGGYQEPLTQWTADQIVAAAKQARANQKPALMKVAVTDLPGVTMNRRDPAGSYDYDTRRFTAAYDPHNPENATDPALTVIKIDGADGAPIALLFHFATHGTVLGPKGLDLSADWVGSARAKIIAAAPGYNVMYMNGAQGDQAPAMDQSNPISDVEYLDVIGGKVAAGVLGTMGQAAPAEAAPVRTVMARLPVTPGDKVLGYRLPKLLTKRYFHELPLQAVRLGDVVFMALPVEAVTEIGQAMKAGARGQGVRYPLVAGLANDHLMYAATPHDFERGGYEVDNTVLGPPEAGILIGEQMLLVRQALRAP
jgi:neutral ceramidase